jgi:hypothetical protein
MSASVNASPRPAATRWITMPANWKPSPSCIRSAADQHMLTEGDIRINADRFREHHLKGDGIHVTAANWSGNWELWLESNKCFRGPESQARYDAARPCESVYFALLAAEAIQKAQPAMTTSEVLKRVANLMAPKVVAAEETVVLRGRTFRVINGGRAA